ncbi:hypothetical protein [Nitrospira moscoviensis]|uniref:SHOCT domain-containing protein n=1 Tax=Nitrospira moscoviensis TaxID=42253 RepID=A0A0K2G8D0_NITMO|nr:hypothetical protein [Nitrospira moscoviensis]ALA57231.1 conserved exported protein of unknown function [Nitrospira moscoviensis]
MMALIRISGLIAVIAVSAPAVLLAGSLDHLTDLTGKVQPIVTLKGRDNFTSEYRYDISVRNVSPDTIVGDSIVVVLDKITNLAGEERESLKSESLLTRFEVLGQDGETDDGKAFFRVPAGNGPDLPPQTESRPASVRIRNKDYLAVFTPAFKVYGLKRQPPAEPRHADAAPAPPPPPSPSTTATRSQIDKLIQLLIKKGVLTEEEWRKANQP